MNQNGEEVNNPNFSKLSRRFFYILKFEKIMALRDAKTVKTKSLSYPCKIVGNKYTYSTKYNNLRYKIKITKNDKKSFQLNEKQEMLHGDIRWVLRSDE